jgi:hypothetical protein
LGQCGACISVLGVMLRDEAGKETNWWCVVPSADVVMEKVPIWPKPHKEKPELGGHDDEIEARTYGFKWSGHHEFAEHVTCRLTGGYRDEIDCFTDDSKVNWTPYEQEMYLLPRLY